MSAVPYVNESSDSDDDALNKLVSNPDASIFQQAQFQQAQAQQQHQQQHQQAQFQQAQQQAQQLLQHHMAAMPISAPSNGAPVARIPPPPSAAAAATKAAPAPPKEKKSSTGANGVKRLGGPFQASDDAVILQRVNEWIHSDMALGLWSSLENELNRKGNTIFSRWKNVLGPQNPELFAQLVDARARQVASQKKNVKIINAGGTITMKPPVVLPVKKRDLRKAALAAARANGEIVDTPAPKKQKKEKVPKPPKAPKPPKPPKAPKAPKEPKVPKEKKEPKAKVAKAAKEPKKPKAPKEPKPPKEKKVKAPKEPKPPKPPKAPKPPKPDSNQISWTSEMDALLTEGVGMFGNAWVRIAEHVGNGVCNERCFQRWKNTVDPSLKLMKQGPWSEEELTFLSVLVVKHARAPKPMREPEPGKPPPRRPPTVDWTKVSEEMQRPVVQCRHKWATLEKAALKAANGGVDIESGSGSGSSSSSQAALIVNNVGAPASISSGSLIV